MLAAIASAALRGIDAETARSAGRRGLLLPGISAEEAALVEGVAVYHVDSLAGAVNFLSGKTRLPPQGDGPTREM